jgi:Tfp pilus assembly protein PilN
MIKVNLLEGAADTRAATRATKAAAKTTQQFLLIAGAVVALLVALSVDYYVSKEKLDKAEKDLAEQQAASVELAKNREQKEALEKQIKNVQERIKVIDDLQKTQQGPSAMLSLINSKMPPPSSVRLDKISQVGQTVTIQGVADNADIVSEFSKGLELGSNNLFQNVSLNVERHDEEQTDPEDETLKRIVTTYNFTISAKYAPTEVGQPAAQPGAAGAPAGAPAPAAAPAAK